MRLLRIVDGDEKLSVGYVYEGMYRAIKGIKDIFKKNKRLYRPYTTIIKTRWDNQLRKNIHAAAYWLNPTFQYDQASFCQKPEVMNSVLDVIETKATSSKAKLMNELRLFRDRQDSFGRELAIITSKKTQPDEWWKMFGHSAPNLQKLAIRILSQTSSSSGCERNWSVFERIHTKKRNRLEHHRHNDLVCVHYNLRLKNRKYYKTRNYDPIDIESIDKTEFWIIEEERLEQEEPPLLDYDELEKMLYKEDEPPRYKKIQEQIRKRSLKFLAKAEKAMGIDTNPFPKIGEVTANIIVPDFQNLSLKELEKVNVQKHVASQTTIKKDARSLPAVEQGFAGQKEDSDKEALDDDSLEVAGHAKNVSQV
ncbi:uncharacterized protein LOC114289927 [Camellia sinensis]|uniref:uncharacterized protein LOC114289927 n=1 Tax=Camellia sinensis TaxID=4442 RepID=UPI0010369D53|nr:uncharacterized protein LOC114289927 [Camellia sinensis]